MVPGGWLQAASARRRWSNVTAEHTAWVADQAAARVLGAAGGVAGVAAGGAGVAAADAEPAARAPRVYSTPHERIVDLNPAEQAFYDAHGHIPVAAIKRFGVHAPWIIPAINPAALEKLISALVLHSNPLTQGNLTAHFAGEADVVGAAPEPVPAAIIEQELGTTLPVGRGADGELIMAAYPVRRKRDQAAAGSAGAGVGGVAAPVHDQALLEADAAAYM